MTISEFKKYLNYQIHDEFDSLIMLSNLLGYNIEITNYKIDFSNINKYFVIRFNIKKSQLKYMILFDEGNNKLDRITGLMREKKDQETLMIKLQELL